MSAAAVLLAAALLVGPGPRAVFRSADLRRKRRPRRADSGPCADPFATASAFDILAVCLAGGMTPAAAAAVTAGFAPAGLGAFLRRASDLLALGADPDSAWQGADPRDPGCVALARLARRSASSGSALAGGAAELAEQSRQEATHAATAAAERASVLIAGPLGLCFLPAFVCLGIVPVVAGLAADVFGAGLL